MEPFVIEITPGLPAPAAAAIDPATGSGVAQVLGTLLERGGVSDVSELHGHIWIGDRWHAQIQLGANRHDEDASFDQGHHLLFRLAEQTARWREHELPAPVIRAFEDLRTSSPAALLAYCAGCGEPVDGRGAPFDCAERPAYAQPAGDPGEPQPAEAARRHWTRAFELDPSFVAPRTALAGVLLERGSAASAAALLTGVAVQDAGAAASLGLSLWAQGEPVAAQALLQQAVHHNPDDAVAAAALAALLARTIPPDAENASQALDEALLLATRSTQLASDDYRCWAALGDIYRVRGDFSQAGFYYGFALRLEPDARTVLKDAAACWLMAREPGQALPLLDHALALDGNDAELHGNLAFVHDALGDSSAALAAARHAVELAPADARFLILHGDLAHKAGQREEALAAWARATELEPGMTINPTGGNIGLPEAAPA